MKRSEFDKLKEGDVVAPYRGKFKDCLAEVTAVWYIPHPETPDTYVIFEFLDESVEKKAQHERYVEVLDYRALKVVESI